MLGKFCGCINCCCLGNSICGPPHPEGVSPWDSYDGGDTAYDYSDEDYSDVEAGIEDESHHQVSAEESLGDGQFGDSWSAKKDEAAEHVHDTSEEDLALAQMKANLNEHHKMKELPTSAQDMLPSKSSGGGF